MSLVGIATAHGQMHSDANVPFANSMFRIPDAPPPRVASYDEATGACAGDRCYGQSAMGWSQNIVACARGVRIGVISSGIDARHPAFAGTALAHNNLTPYSAGRTCHWHGTALLALLAGNLSGGVKGLIPEATFSFADVFFADGQGAPVADVVSLLKALNWMQAQNLHVVLLDMAGPRDELVDAAISSLVKSGAVVVMPAGPGGSMMSSHPDVITVAAVDKKMAISKDASLSSRIGLVAPGVDIWTALPGNKYGYVTGNSFAAAYVTAALATVRTLEPNSRATEVRDRALAYLPVKDLGAGYGRGLALPAKDCIPKPRAVLHQPGGGWMSGTNVK